MIEHPRALPHADLEEIAPGVHWVQGSAVMGPGIRISRNMTVVVHEGIVTVINAVRLDDAGERRLAELGKVEHVVKIGWVHGMDDPYYLERYGAAYWTLPNGARDQDPKATETLAADHLPFPDGELFAFQQTKKPEAALLVKRAGGTLVTCDSAQNWPDTRGCSFPAKIVTHLMGFTKRPAQIGPMWRKGMTPQGGSLKSDFERMARLDFDQLIGAHGSPLRSGARQALEATVAATYD